MTVYIAFGSAPVGKALFLALFEHAKIIDLVGHSRIANEAIRETRRERPDLVIVEEVLSHGWGMDVIQGLEPRNGAPAVVMVSTMPPPRVPEEYRSESIDLWLQLPQDYEQLRSALRQLVKDDSAKAVAAWRAKVHKSRTGWPTDPTDGLKSDGKR